ncbi:GIY-YIG nuclease family protein [Bradyrhizobium pachyrhizi]|uniref:GIY-YIG nuclease family protein n=1 Tax=Bradyrhizobium pachyrhizi TaxID=280333 RepID=UPI003D9ACAB8
MPFNIDVHALFFSNDAVGIETSMHDRLADCRVNAINRRREFFRAAGGSLAWSLWRCISAAQGPIDHRRRRGGSATVIETAAERRVMAKRLSCHQQIAWA